jgi:glucose/arabinose dehydrogenase
LNKVGSVFIAVSIIISAFLLQSIYGQEDAISPSDNIIKYYGCENYILTFHCDPLHNNMVGYGYTGHSIRIHDLRNFNSFFVDGKYGKALELRAPYREAIHIPTVSNFNFNDFSVSFWINGAQQAEPVGQVVSYTNSLHSAGWFFDVTAINSTDQLIRFVFTDNAGHYTASPDVSVKPGTFHQITGTFNGSSIKIYKDAHFIGETKHPGNYTGDAGIPLTIGSAAYCASCNRWSGTIDDLRIYTRTLGPEQVKEIFDNYDNKIPGLFAHWTFDSQFNDISGNNNNGTESTLLASMIFSPDGRLFFTEKNSGAIRIFKDNKILDRPFAILSDVYVNWEQGLLGITLDPKFEDNHFVYAYYTASGTGPDPINRVVRFTEENNEGKDMKVILDNVPASRGYHSGGALAFGPDDKLYITVGDATEHPFAQDPSIVVGKLLRINRDGTIPPDNPFPNSPVYTLGHRNMYGIAFDNYGNGLLSENGDYYYDEIDLIQKAGNYGFPTFQPANTSPELANSSTSIRPLRSYWNTIAPTQMIYYTGDKIPLLKNKFVVGSYSGDLYVLRLDNKTKEIVQESRIDLENYPFKPIVGIAESAGGDIYFGAYTLFKLNATVISPKSQYLFPVEINISASSSIQGMNFDPAESKMLINLHNQVNGNNSKTTGQSGQLPSSFLGLKIPTALMNNIGTVLDSQTGKELPFINNNSSNLDYSSITIQVPPVADLQIILIGSTLASPGEQILRG